MASQSPFYYQITQTKEDFTDANGLPKSIDLPLITLPPGTVLFRGMKIPNPAEVDARVFYRDYLGDPEGSKVCMRPTQNVFFYPFPYVAFGANQVGKTFDMMQMVVLVNPITVVCSISPSQWVRGMGQRYGGNAPYRRCDSFPLSCHPLTQEEKVGLSYDNCLSPEYQIRSGTRGWMALADLDSFNPDKPRGSTEPATGPNSSMKLYVKELEARKPGAGAELAAWSYTDAKRHHGFPEISIYPYKTHQGNRLLNRYCPNSEAAIRLMAKEATADNLNFLPLATFTRNGTVDMVNGFFTYDSLGVSENSFSTPAADKQPAIERKIGEYMDLLQTKGVRLPFFGAGKLSLDTRTGFYILPQVIPRNFMMPIPAEVAEPSGPVGGGGSSAAAAVTGTSQPYRYLALGLDTPEAKKRALNYILIFRNAIPAKFMEKYGLDKGFGIRRAMVFDRPPVLPRVFQELDLDVPKEFKAGIARAAALFQKNSGAPKKTKVVAAAAAAVPAPAPAAEPEFGGRTPEFGGRTPEYGSTTPPYAASPKYITVEEAKEELKAGKSFDSLRDKLSPTNLKKVAGMHKEFGFSPPFLAEEEGGAPPYLAIGGTRKAKKSKGTKGTKGTKGAKTKGTRKVKSLESVAKLFHKVWKSVGKR